MPRLTRIILAEGAKFEPVEKTVEKTAHEAPSQQKKSSTFDAVSMNTKIRCRNEQT